MLRSGSGGPFAALIVQRRRIIAEGTNRVTLSNDPTAHAEVVAIREACRALADFQLTDCDLYTTCEPCPMCLGAIYWARPARVFFAATATDAASAGFDDAFIYEELKIAPGGAHSHDADPARGFSRYILAWKQQENRPLLRGAPESPQLSRFTMAYDSARRPERAAYDQLPKVIGVVVRQQ